MTSGKYLENLLIVKDSGIHGKGLFSTVDIAEGSKIFVIEGEAISEEECIKREADGNVYIFWNESNYIDTSMTNKIKYINHNCDCNCDVLDNDEESLLLVAYRDIKAGEELTIDYGYEEIYELCQCNICA
ncbi:MAG TPA: SET domain-containing protein [Candidatus Deferrimicrobium sp.]|nr:SET domain-containing protein [Candidatus Deferrimicrobium sp.]